MSDVAGGLPRSSEAAAPRARVGVVVMSYGTPASPEEIEAYYTDVRRGRPPSPEQLADLQRRYTAIGGLSPLLERTRAQVASITAALESEWPGRFVVELGTKHGRPRIEDAVTSLAVAGAGEVVGLVLAPHYSALSIGEYASRLEAAAGEAGLGCAMVESWHLLPELIAALSARVASALHQLGHPPAPDAVEVLFTAHSLPRRILALGDPYPAQLEETAAAVAGAASVERWRTAWQSAGRTPEPWLGPDLRHVVRQLAAQGARAVVVCPAGFTSDHLEVLYDIDVEARAVAEEVGITLVRTPSLNEDGAVCAGLARLVAEMAGLARSGDGA